MSIIEMERIQKLEQETAKLRDEVAMSRIVISCLLQSQFRDNSSEAFFQALRNELNNLPVGFMTQQDYTYKIQKWIDDYR